MPPIRIRFYSVAWLSLVVALTRTTHVSAFVQPSGLALPVSLHKHHSNLYSKTSPNAPGLKDSEPNQSEESPFDPFNYAENKAAELISVESSNNQDDGNHDIGLWWARGILLIVAVLWGTNFASVKYLETLCFHPPCVHPPSEAALARFGLAGIVSVPLLINQVRMRGESHVSCCVWFLTCHSHIIPYYNTVCNN